MNSTVYNQVLDECYVVSNGAKYAWTIPIAFPITADMAKTLKAGQKVALTAPNGDIVATLDVSDVYAWPKLKYLRSVYLTDRIDHPGADMIIKGEAANSHLIGGEIKVLPQPKNSSFGKYVLTPREVRKLLASKGWNAVVAFQPLIATHCIALMNTHWSTVWKLCCVRDLTPVPA